MVQGTTVVASNERNDTQETLQFISEATHS